MAHEPAMKIEPDEVIDRIYEIALEPSSLDEFIDFWHDSGLAERIADNVDGVSTEFDELYQTHFERAQIFLQRGDDARPDFSDYLSPYDNLAAFAVSTSFRVEAANPGGQAAFGVTSGDHLEDICLPAEMREALIRTTKQVLRGKPYSEKLLKADMGSKRGAVLFRVTQLEKHLEDGPAALIVSTQFHWRNSVSELLGAVFQLTKSEQDIVRLLTEGKSVKLIAAERNVSEGTVRGQIKIIIGKMNIRGQGDIIRLAMAFSRFPGDASGNTDTLNPASPALSGNWLEAEVWKPFKSVSLPDHRQLTYHDMGPPTGNPVLFSHMGSCMVRWSPSMIRLAYERNLRVICPIRAGYGHSDKMAVGADPFSVTRNDCAFLLESLRIPRLPYVVQGSDLPFAADMVANRPELITEMIAIGGQLLLPGGQSVEGTGRWQKFFVALARNAPKHGPIFSKGCDGHEQADRSRSYVAPAMQGFTG